MLAPATSTNQTSVATPTSSSPIAVTKNAQPKETPSNESGSMLSGLLSILSKTSAPSPQTTASQPAQPNPTLKSASISPSSASSSTTTLTQATIAAATNPKPVSTSANSTGSWWNPMTYLSSTPSKPADAPANKPSTAPAQQKSLSSITSPSSGSDSDERPNLSSLATKNQMPAAPKTTHSAAQITQSLPSGNITSPSAAPTNSMFTYSNPVKVFPTNLGFNHSVSSVGNITKSMSSHSKSAITPYEYSTPKDSAFKAVPPLQSRFSLGLEDTFGSFGGSRDNNIQQKPQLSTVLSSPIKAYQAPSDKKSKTISVANNSGKVAKKATTTSKQASDTQAAETNEIILGPVRRVLTRKDILADPIKYAEYYNNHMLADIYNLPKLPENPTQDQQNFAKPATAANDKSSQTPSEIDKKQNSAANTNKKTH
jgi:hypothetical protein